MGKQPTKTLSAAELEKIREMIDWYEQHKDSGPPVDMPGNRPLFKGERKNTGVILSKSVVKAARRKMNTDRARVGKSLSQLVEVLLWQYAGSPVNLVEGATGDTAE